MKTKVKKSVKEKRLNRHNILQKFVAFVGEGNVKFPSNLSELSEAVALFEQAVHYE